MIVNESLPLFNNILQFKEDFGCMFQDAHVGFCASHLSGPEQTDEYNTVGLLSV